MADIFLSYAREDLAWASRLATALAERGWSVFWDRRIPTGKSFDRVIEKELDAARCVIVLWSPHAVASHWVRAESREGARRDILHPVWVEDVKVPLEFRALQTVRLVDWQAGAQHAEFDQLLADITAILGPSPVTPARTTERGHSGTEAVTTTGVESLGIKPVGEPPRREAELETVVLKPSAIEPISSLSGETRVEGAAATAESPTGQADAPAHEAKPITYKPRYWALGSIAAVGVLLIAISVMMLMRSEAPQTLTGDRRPAPAASVATTTAKADPLMMTLRLTASYLQGQWYYEGRGVERDYAKAAELYRQAAEAGHARAQARLGVMYANGEGVPKDAAEAVKWLRKAADQGDSRAQFNMGIMYDRGQGVPKDYVEAAKWYRKAADQGDEFGQYNLGVMYDTGRGVPKDAAEAVKWFTKAAEPIREAADRGDAAAQAYLSDMYAKGQGVPKNELEALKWSLKAREGELRFLAP